ncbi:MAG: two-component sensor histidine kinase, partial [Acetatifactor sp.]|nr:two-component sensor histidine kinase [Acetatifactor sp.]
MKTIRKLVEMIRQKMPLKSLRLRIFAIVLVVGLVPGLIVGMGIVQNYEDRAVEHRISTVQNQLKIVANHLISNDYMANYRSEEQVYRNSRAVVNAELEMLSNLYEGRVMIINSNFKVVKDTYGISQGKIMISEEVIKCFQGESLSNYDPEHGYIEMTTPIMDTTANSGQEVVSGVMLTSISNGSIVAMMEMLNRRVMIIETLLALAIVVLAIVLAVVMTRPFNRITQAIMDVNSGYSDESISVTDYAETVHIVDAFNQLLARMRALDQSRQEFVANVSHELKTPMTSIKVLADSLLVEQEVPAQLYREFME